VLRHGAAVERKEFDPPDLCSHDLVEGGEGRDTAARIDASIAGEAEFYPPAP
jgi:hypothetical protein